jgi:hypothetical protein
VNQVRRRNAVLEALEAFRRLEPTVNLTQVVAFCYVAENEGLSISELAYLLGATRATGSRTAHSLLPRDGDAALAPYLGLVTITAARGAVSKSVELTALGRQLRSQIDALIAEGVQIDGGLPRGRRAMTDPQARAGAPAS